MQRKIKALFELLLNPGQRYFECKHLLIPCNRRLSDLFNLIQSCNNHMKRAFYFHYTVKKTELQRSPETWLGLQDLDFKINLFLASKRQRENMCYQGCEENGALVHLVGI